MSDGVDLDYIYDALGGPANIRRNFPRQNQFGFPSLDEQCAAYPWSTVHPILEKYEKASEQAILATFWPHIAHALFDFYTAGPIPPIRASGSRAVVEAYERVAKKVWELEQALVDIDDLSLDVPDVRRPEHTDLLFGLRETMWIRAGHLKTEKLSGQISANDQRLEHLAHAWKEPGTRATAIVDAQTTLSALRVSATEVSVEASNEVGMLGRLPGPFDVRLFYLLEALARVWISITGKQPSEALGRPGARVFTNFAVDCAALPAPLARRHTDEVTVSKVKALAKFAGEWADQKLQELNRYTS